MEIQYLISTMDRDSISFFENMNIKSNALIINQYGKDKYIHEISRSISNIEVINANERGLSKSRNKALENAQGEICVICDDDVTYTEEASQIILNAYSEFPDADIIVFQLLNSQGKPYKNYSSFPQKINFLKSLKISSVEITFKRNSIQSRNIKFNERFGSGSEFSSGEESIFLKNCLDNDLKIQYVPKVIAKLNDSESSWFNGFNKEYFENKGACYYAISKNLYLLLIMQFVIRKKTLYKENLTMIKAFQYMIKGVKLYKKEVII